MFSTRGGFFNNDIIPSTFANSAFNFGSNRYLDVSWSGNTDALNNIVATSGWTMEYWFYITNTSSFGLGSSGAGPGGKTGAGTTQTGAGSLGPDQNQRISFQYYMGAGSISINTNANVYTANTWNNIACVTTTSGSNTTFSIYVNGTREQIQVGSGSFANTQTVSNAVAGGTAWSIGQNRVSGIFARTWSNIYFDNLRVSNVNRYSGASYSVSTVPFTSDSQTQLLMLMNGSNGSTTFTDSSSQARTITNSPSTGNVYIYISNARTNHS
jgi:hypothetical protein